MPVSVVITNYHRDITELLASIPRGNEVVVVNDDRLSLSEKRNYGILKTTKDLIYFVDDDNILEWGAIEYLRDSFRYGKKNIGIIGSVAQWGKQDVDTGSYRDLISGFMVAANKEPGLYEVDEVANAFMVKREVFDKIGLLDEMNFPMDMDEADLCLRAKRAGYKVCMNSFSVVRHPLCPKFPKFRRKRSAYYMGRNRILFQRKHLGGKYWKFLLFYMPVFIVIYVTSLILLGQINFVFAFLKGVVHGLFNKSGRCKEY